MSSENSSRSSSSSSRIRQFGLYRSIDARTEEFLRLSMKKQIRQGCACAAVSTAITITVVIVVFIVYECSLNSEINLEGSIRANWLNLMNVTNEGQTFDSNFPRNVDQATLHLLPLLMKAYKKNFIIEKVIEDSSSNPLYDKKYTTTDDYKNKAIFTRKWLRIPTSKLFTFEYKTAPVVYYRTPTENVKYFTKIRKIRDDQRLIDYVDKMINEKSYMGSTKPMIKGQIFRVTEATPKKLKMNTKQMTTPLNTETTPKYIDSFKQTTKTTETTPKNMDSFKQRKKIAKSTPKNMDSFKQKTKIAKSTPKNMDSYKQTMETTPYNMDIFKRTLKLNTTNQFIQKSTLEVINVTKEGTKASTCKCSTVSTLLQKILTTIQNAINRTTILSPIQQVSKETVSKELAPFELNTTTIKPLTKRSRHLQLPIPNKYLPNNLNIDERKKTTTTSLQQLQSTEYDDIFVPKMTKPMYHYYDPRYLENDNNDINVEKLIKRKRLDDIGNDLEIKKKTENDKNTKRQNDFLNKNRNTNHNDDAKVAIPNFLKDLNSALFKLIDENIIRLTLSITTELPVTSTNLRYKKDHSKETEMTEMTEIKNIPTSSLAPSTPSSTEKNFEADTKNTTKKEMFKETVATTTERVATQKFSPSSLSSPLMSSFALPLTTTLVSPLAAPFEINNFTIPLAPKSKTTDVPIPKHEEEVVWEELKIEDVPAWKSMLPINRPAYLEIYRNDFKRQEDPPDFEYNMNNAVYDVI